MGTKIKKSDDEWKKELTNREFNILRKKGTEQPFTGKYLHNEKEGTYICAGCGNKLFLSYTKFDSGTGWPSFWDPVSKDEIETKPDDSSEITRIEVTCSKCGGHLGHLFKDGPEPTGQRFCINSIALDFKEQELT